MTDQELVAACQGAGNLEGFARAHRDASRVNPPERDAALGVMRHAIALKRDLERWIAARALRATTGS